MSFLFRQGRSKLYPCLERLTYGESRSFLGGSQKNAEKSVGVMLQGECMRPLASTGSDIATKERRKRGARSCASSSTFSAFFHDYITMRPYSRFPLRVNWRSPLLQLSNIPASPWLGGGGGVLSRASCVRAGMVGNPMLGTEGVPR